MNAVKAANSKGVLDKIQKMLQHFNTYNFIKLAANESIEFDFNTENLKESIRREWLLTSLVSCDQPTFQFKLLSSENHLKCAFENVSKLVNTIPFTFVEVDNVQETNKSDNLVKNTAVDLISNQFKKCSGTLLRTQTFCSPDKGVEFFHKQQRERKIWWRKFSALPGRFHTTEISSDANNKSQFIEIQAEFPWGFETVEHIRYLPATGDNFEMKNQQKKFLPHRVTCETLLEKITFTYLCDSYEGINEESDRTILRFNRKLAPYKVAFAANATSAETNQNLKDLALLLAKKIRKNGFPVLLLPDVCSSPTDRQVLRNDGLGVPYTIILNETTLKDGIINIRSRDTTLKEQSHVSLIESYVEKLLKNC